jgi:N-acetylglucosaminyldiphosphoundecaprenol N-acetyl-beta-D-mannosaminyltransferase
VIAVNPEKVIRARQDPGLLAQLRTAGLLIPDGIGVVFAARILGLGRMKQVPGCELMPEICDLSARKGYRIYLLGGRPEVNREVESVLTERYQGIQIVGRQSGYFKESEIDGIVENINMSGAQILFIALGSPKQELWMRKYLQNSTVKVCQGVGGTFDVLAGEANRAPSAFRRMHLEWFYRLLSDPRRIIRQIALPKFMFAVIRKKMLG